VGQHQPYAGGGEASTIGGGDASTIRGGEASTIRGGESSTTCGGEASMIRGGEASTRCGREESRIYKRQTLAINMPECYIVGLVAGRVASAAGGSGLGGLLEALPSRCGTGPVIWTGQEQFRRAGRRAARASLARRYSPYLGGRWPRPPGRRSGPITRCCWVPLARSLTEHADHNSLGHQQFKRVYVLVT
jgi:hypothetical protein